MTTTEAQELLENHLGPQAYININEQFKRHSGEQWARNWYVYTNIPEPMHWERNTLSEVVAAVMSSVPAYKQDGKQ